MARVFKYEFIVDMVEKCPLARHSTTFGLVGFNIRLESTVDLSFAQGSPALITCVVVVWSLTIRVFAPTLAIFPLAGQLSFLSDPVIVVGKLLEISRKLRI